jgi:hypothetical protein
MKYHDDINDDNMSPREFQGIVSSNINAIVSTITNLIGSGVILFVHNKNIV